MHMIRMPKLDHMAEEGVLLAWHKKEGEEVAEGDVLFEFESEKATEEVRAEAGGILLKVVVKEGETAPVSSIVGFIGEKGEEVPVDPDGKSVGAGTATSPRRRRSAEKTAAAAAQTDEKAAAAPREKEVSGQVKIPPLVRRLARENSIDLEELKRSVSGSVAKREDVEAFIAERASRETAPAGPAAGAAQGARAAEPRAAERSGDAVIPLTGIRKTMFERMSRVASTYAATTTIQKADVTRLIELKQGLSRRWEEEAKPRYITFFTKAVSLAIPAFPILNSTVDDEAGVIRVRKAINIGIAVDSQRGLLVPVLHDV
ncbi:MAG: 2-oxo acid dehydrogenase subunit E2, partial [Spirochaetales bacterium]|nr:2-oxo acid dehydrogenase subunit E2 [Spirochaetales bacterium]